MQETYEGPKFSFGPWPPCSKFFPENQQMLDPEVK